jgi:hypothetical protein
MGKKEDYKYRISETVYIKTDPEQNAGIITAITWWGDCIYSYTVVFGFDTFDIREECLTNEKQII